MRSKLVRVQLAIFGVIAIAVVAYAGYAYAGFQRYTGIGTYTVTAELHQAGGLYPSALVTYRGVDVGVVTTLDGTTSGANAKLQIRSEYKIPTDVEAYVRSVSVAGEQFIDLVPRSSNGPTLADGSTIPVQDTNTPVAASQVINQVTGLLETVPKDSLRTVLDETSHALDQTGDDLNKALAASSDLVRQASQTLDPTIQLLQTANPLLVAVNDSGPDVSRTATNLRSFTQQLALSDQTLSNVLDSGAPFFDTTSSLLQELRPTVPVLLANLQTVGEVLRVNVPGIRHVLIVYPAISNAANAALAPFQQSGDMSSGQGELDVKFGNTQNTPPCAAGYDMSRRNPGDVGYAPMPQGQYCQLPQDDYRVTRGARNAPCATDHSVRSGDVARCPGGLPSTWPQMLARPGIGYQVPPAARGDTGVVAVPYDPTTGRFRVPGQPAEYTLGNLISPNSSDQKVVTTWQELFPR
ncbi:MULTISPECIES: MlaD family protein [unclassified Gordonia (in: high G+C Gram-positive bacteria)]|uniref:MlaD family protein n=1 Tax=unclassified Gordonia (in: high G+C Gram-positive bacteria) TaxID=2657482 RepID=UPI0009AC23F7|nr:MULTISPECIES: MlaD family protein [unclassified Gordonia (in: high G+C Gram-positive bacteria)]MDF3284153.1 MlaD family protein [Gordonia sp. N1V]OPX16594.1 mammalian cell entry protein [Gordonia sp. i37]